VISQAIAQYVAALHRAAESTHRAEDRPVYQSLLASAAVVLAMAELENADSLQELARSHERLRGQVWLADEAHLEATRLWSSIFAELNEHAI